MTPSAHGDTAAADGGITFLSGQRACGALARPSGVSPWQPYASSGNMVKIHRPLSAGEFRAGLSARTRAVLGRAFGGSSEEVMRTSQVDGLDGYGFEGVLRTGCWRRRAPIPRRRSIRGAAGGASPRLDLVLRSSSVL